MFSANAIVQRFRSNLEYTKIHFESMQKKIEDAAANGDLSVKFSENVVPKDMLRLAAIRLSQLGFECELSASCRDLVVSWYEATAREML